MKSYFLIVSLLTIPTLFKKNELIYEKNMIAITVFDVANFFLSKESMSQKKLQRLVYFSYVWTLTLLNENEHSLKTKLFTEEIQAWIHGPVCPKLWEKYNSYGWELIPKVESIENRFPPDVLDILEQVWSVYRKFNGNQLEAISRKEDPWMKAREGISETEPSNNVLNDEIIYKYYSDRIKQT